MADHPPGRRPKLRLTDQDKGLLMMVGIVIGFSALAAGALTFVGNFG